MEDYFFLVLVWLFVLASLLASVLPVLMMVRLVLVFRRPEKLSVAFFHPYCNDGGGGERVLWRMIQQLQKSDQHDKLEIVVYTGDQVSGEDILRKAKERFGLTIAPVKFVHLRLRRFVEKDMYPMFTILGQSLGSILLALEAVYRYSPHIVFDSMGYAFTFLVFKLLASCGIGCYVHYPTISTDMISSVESGNAAFNNDEAVAGSPLKTSIKLKYYQVFAVMYGFVAGLADLVIVNSSWTYNHIKHIWNPIVPVNLVYPPCDTTGLKALPLAGRKNFVVSIAQFRPEKNHMLQLEAMQLLVTQHPELQDAVLLMMGSLRAGNAEDQKIVDQLEKARAEMGLEKHVQILKNVSNDELKANLAKAKAGLHTMYNEHFGIGVVELMAAGVIPIANNSAGPKEDIVVLDEDDQETGFLALTKEEYAEALYKVLSMPSGEFDKLQLAARNSTERFSDEEFGEQIQRCFDFIPELKEISQTE